MAMLNPELEKTGGDAVYPTSMQAWYDVLYLGPFLPGQLEPEPNMVPENQLGTVNEKV